MPITRRRLLVSTAAIASVVGCAPRASGPAQTAAPTALRSPLTTLDRRFGVAGLTPARFPNSGADDWRAFYQSIPDVGGLLGVYLEWSEAGEQTVPKAIGDTAGNAKAFGFEPLILLGAQRLTGDPGQTKRLGEMAAKVARDHAPRYLGVGNEVNVLARDDRAKYEAFRAALPEVRAAVRDAAPETKVFIVLQLELLVGGAYLMTTVRRSEPQWAILDELAPHVDLVAFTTYPYLDHERPEDVPDYHYSQVTSRVSLPIGFTEVGWPSRPFATAPSSGHGGTPEEQAAFARRFLSLTKPLDPRFALWLFMHDPANAGPPHDSNALRENDGRAKPVYDVWSRAGS